MEKVFEFKKGDKVLFGDTFECKLLDSMAIYGTDFTSGIRNIFSYKILRPFTITIKIDYKDNH